jgi:hypothetical protein
MRVHDVLPSKGLTSFHRNGPQVVACDLRVVGPILRTNFQRSRFRTLKEGSSSLSFVGLPRQITEEPCAQRSSRPLRFHIDPQLLALLIEMAPLKPQRLCRIRYVPPTPLQLGQQSRPLKLRHSLR